MNNRRTVMVNDWALMIENLLDKGLTHRRIGEAMHLGGGVTEKMLRHYRLGAQPLAYRADGLVELWCVTMEATREALPKIELIRGHRVATVAETGPRVRQLPNWPPGQILKPAAKAEAPKKRGRPRKVSEPA